MNDSGTELLTIAFGVIFGVALLIIVIAAIVEVSRDLKKPKEVRAAQAAQVKAAGAATGKIGYREKFSDMTTNGACPNCGGTNFTAKRSNTGKVAAGVLAPKSQVRCVTCGAMFKRG